MAPVANRIMDRVMANGAGEWVCTPKDFLDFGSREAIDQALYRLVKAGELRRVGHGLYRMLGIGEVQKSAVSADLDSAIAALARRDGVRMMPDGMFAANQLGLTNVVPAEATYVTDGHSRTLKIDGRAVQFRHAGPQVMWWAGRPAGPVVQALRWLGRDAATDDRVISELQHRLSVEVKSDLVSKHAKFTRMGNTAGQEYCNRHNQQRMREISK